MAMIPLTNFTKGEIAPELQARIDTDQYGAAAKKIRNFIIQRYGGLSFRPGFRLVGEVDDKTKNTRYIPFQYNMEQAYIMALEDQRMRLLTGGGMVAEDNLKITGISNSGNAQVTVAYHGYAVGDRIFFSGVEGMVELNNRSATVVSVVDVNSFTIDIDTSTYTPFVSSDGTARTVAPDPTPPDPTPPPPPPAEPPPPTTVGGGGTGSGTGTGGGAGYDGYYRREVGIKPIGEP